MKMKGLKRCVEKICMEKSIPAWYNNIDQITDLLGKIKYIKNSTELSEIVDKMDSLGYGEYDSNSLAEWRKNVIELENIELKKEKEVNGLKINGLKKSNNLLSNLIKTL